MNIIYIIFILNSFGGGVDIARTLEETQMMANTTTELTRYEYQKKVAIEYSSLEPSQPVIDAFITEVMQLDDFGVKYELSHAKRVKIAKQMRRTAQRESGLGRSRLAHKLNNHVGTKLARKRFTWASGKGYLNYAKFDNWCYSYLDAQEYILKYGHSWIK